MRPGGSHTHRPCWKHRNWWTGLWRFSPCSLMSWKNNCGTETEELSSSVPSTVPDTSALSCALNEWKHNFFVMSVRFRRGTGAVCGRTSWSAWQSHFIPVVSAQSGMPFTCKRVSTLGMYVCHQNQWFPNILGTLYFVPHVTPQSLQSLSSVDSGKPFSLWSQILSLRQCLHYFSHPCLSLKCPGSTPGEGRERTLCPMSPDYCKSFGV